MYKCKYCNVQSEYKFNIDRHEKSKHGNNKNSYIRQQPTQIQSGSDSVVKSTTHIPIEKYKEVVDEMHKWKFENEKWGEAYRLLEEHRMEDGEHSLAIINYLQNVLNANNIRYNLDLA